MTTQDALHPLFTETFPATMDEGLLYISVPYRTCSHLCCCGCGHEVITPLSPAQWSVTYDGENVSLSPSIGNWSLPCQSHYWIRDGRVRWSRRYSAAEVDQNRDRDRRLLARDTRETGPTRLSRLRRHLLFWRQ
ncbi:DUF6527 family protein [Streptomyces sp. 135]|uniref:DUF6527 family protein n=1 Tax=Streptomyces sp. 135 TaxID=2838850 RepID=UPI001CBBBC8F|nr:DUF6527 family protein [Streptomyces sp. 135]